MKTAKRILAVLMVAVMAFSACITASAAEKATSLKLNATTIKWIVGKSGSFKPTVTPAGASKTFKWTSSNTKVATVSTAGKLTAVSVGTATITCATTDGSNLKATCKVTVGKAVTSVKLNATTINWPAGKSGTFKPTVSPSDAMNKSLTWSSSNTKVATISSEGKLTAVSAGTATITCKAADGSGKYATCKVTVTGGSNIATALKLNATKINWPVGKSGSFKPTVTPSTASQTFKWTSSDPTVATISASGKLTAVSAGTTTITCATTDGSNLKATCAVTVWTAVTSVNLNASSLTWVTGRSGSFKATVLPANASQTLEWTSSDESVATVSSTGKLTTLKVGTTTITCKATDGSGKYATCVVNVKQGVNSIILNKETANIKIGETTALSATVNPSDAYNKTLTWTSSNENVATVSSTGVVTGKEQGSAIITCTAKDGSNKSATCTITVEPNIVEVVLAESVTLNTSSITWITGKSGSFKATVLPANASQTLEWTSSDESVATVSSTGKLTTLKVGTTTITCKATDGSGKYDTCEVTVVQPVTSVSLDVSTVSLIKDKTTTLKPTIEPSNAYNKNVTWTSSNSSVASVSSSGVITAKASGTAIITCKAADGSDNYATCMVTVGSKLTGLALNAKTITWEKGKSGSFKPVYTPSDAITTLSWQSLNPTVATVDSNGKLTAKQAGTATIVCKTTDGTNKTAYCYVLVTDSSKPSTNYNTYFKNYFNDGVYTISGKTSVDVDGEKYDSDIKYGVNAVNTNICIELSIMLFKVKMLTRADGMYMVIPALSSYQKVNEADATNSKLFDNLVYKGSSTGTVSGTACTIESFNPYGSNNLTVQFCFNSSGTLKYIKQIKADGTNLLISSVKVSGTYTSSDYEIPSGYKDFSSSDSGN